jgi:hypothetical protein
LARRYQRASFIIPEAIARKFKEDAFRTGKCIFLDSDLKIDQKQSILMIDRDRIAQVGLKMNDIVAALATLLGGGYVNYFDYDGRSSKFIPRVSRSFASTSINCSTMTNKRTPFEGRRPNGAGEVVDDDSRTPGLTNESEPRPRLACQACSSTSAAAATSGSLAAWTFSNSHFGRTS